MTPLRALVLGLSGLATVAMLAVIIMIMKSGTLSSGEQLSRDLAWAAIMIYGVPYALFMAPALVLGILNRGLPLALVLCLLTIPAVIISFRNA